MMVIFEPPGDLTLRKLVPALYHLERERLAARAVSRSSGSGGGRAPTTPIRRTLKERIPKLLEERNLDREAFGRLLSRCFYVMGDGTDPSSMKEIGAELDKKGKSLGTGGSAVFYLAVPPEAFLPMIRNLGSSGLLTEGAGRTRKVVIEKPFGRDLETARALNHELGQVARESQIFRIDHYLGKETVQNIMVLRFANGIFEPIWNRDHIDSVQITVAETLGVEGRGDYYETSGALRDMVPNHLFQLLSLIAMEPPNSFEAQDVRDEKFKALRAIEPFSHEDVHVMRSVPRPVRRGRRFREWREVGQWGGGLIGRSRAWRQVRRTETFVALKLGVENWRWGRRAFLSSHRKNGWPSAKPEIVIQFKDAPSQLFRGQGAAALPPNQMILEIQPEERISLQFGAKIPGPLARVGDVGMDFCYKDYFGQVPSNGYETLIYDCMRGDATLFQRADQIERGWSIIAPIQEVWAALPPRDFPDYRAGSWGPAASDDLSRAGRKAVEAFRKTDARRGAWRQKRGGVSPKERGETMAKDNHTPRNPDLPGRGRAFDRGRGRSSWPRRARRSRKPRPLRCPAFGGPDPAANSRSARRARARRAGGLGERPFFLGRRAPRPRRSSRKQLPDGAPGAARPCPGAPRAGPPRGDRAQRPARYRPGLRAHDAQALPGRRASREDGAGLPALRPGLPGSRARWAYRFAFSGSGYRIR